MSFEVLDPTNEEGSGPFELAPRLDSLSGATVGVISNGKQGTRRFFDALARELMETHGAAEVVRVTKTNYSAPADIDIIDKAKQWQALVAGIGD